VHISEIVFSWALGIRLVSTPSARFELLADMFNNVHRLGVTHLGMVPSMIEGTFSGGAEQGSQIGIKYLASGGEKISDSVSGAPMVS
jgi:ferricrocin synthase